MSRMIRDGKSVVIEGGKKIELPLDEARRERLVGFTRGHHIKFKLWRCALCIGPDGRGTPLVADYMIVSDYPYLHADLQLQCLRCERKYLFGVPIDPVVGLELIIWDSHPEEVLKLAQAHETPKCPFHGCDMVLTKIWGDMIFTKEDRDKLRLQWKCPDSSGCFLTEHIFITREGAPLGEDIYSEEDKKIIIERLRKMGYIE